MAPGIRAPRSVSTVALDLSAPRGAANMRGMRSLHALLLVLVLASPACELPQQKNKGAGSDASSGDASGSGERRSWTVVRLVGEGGEAADDRPGADVDALVAFRDDVFLFAGCGETSLFGVGQDHAGKPFVDKGGATLAAREQSNAYGFVSLAGGTLLCELPLPLETGDVLEIWEMEDDGADGWSIGFAETAAADFEGTSGPHKGTQTLGVP